MLVAGRHLNVPGRQPSQAFTGLASEVLVKARGGQRGPGPPGSGGMPPAGRRGRAAGRRKARAMTQPIKPVFLGERPVKLPPQAEICIY